MKRQDEYAILDRNAKGRQMGEGELIHQFRTPVEQGF
jgi:hypothetical protein